MQSDNPETRSHCGDMSSHSTQNKKRYSRGEWLIPNEPRDSWHTSRALGMAEKLTPGTFLDVGCATSPLGRHLHKTHWEAHGIEISEAGKVAAEGGVLIHSFDLAHDWELPENYFDFIFAGEVIEHVLDTRRFANNLYRVAKPGSAVAITTPNLTSLENRLRSVIGVHARFMDFGFADEQIGHCRYFTLKKLYELLEKTGFCNIRVETGNAGLSLTIRGKELQLPRFLNLLNLGTTLFAVASKPTK